MRPFVILLLAFAGLCFLGCDSVSPCGSIDCLNFGLCADGECQCVGGYEGTNCETLTRDRLIGEYMAEEVCTQVAPHSYPVFIGAGQGSADQIIIGNFGNHIIGVNASINGNGITIPEQHIAVQSGWVDVSGNGLIGDSTIMFYYELNDGTTDYECNLVLPLP